MINQKEKQKFDRFLSRIKKEDNVAIVYHTDADGICAASIMVKVLESKGIQSNTLPAQNLRAADQLIPRLNQASRVIVVDIPVDQTDFLQKITKPTLVIDHHSIYENKSNAVIIKSKRLDSSKISDFYCTAKMVYDLAKNKLETRDIDWIAALGIIGDRADKQWSRFMTGVFKRHHIYHRKGASELHHVAQVIFHAISHSMGNIGGCFERVHKAGTYKEVIGPRLKKYDKAIREEVKYWKGNVEKLGEAHPKLELLYDFIKPKYFVNPSVIEVLSNEDPHRTVVIAQDMNNEFLNVSARRADGQVAVNDLLEKSCKNLPKANAGGHTRAAGGVIRREDLFKFRKNMMKVLSDMVAA